MMLKNLTRARAPVRMLCCLVVLLVACQPAPTPTTTPAAGQPTPGGQVIVVTHDSWAVDQVLLAQFSQDTGIRVEVRPAGDAGQILGQALLSAPGADGFQDFGDVLYGVDNTLLGRALDAGLFVAYPPAPDVPQEFMVDPQGRAIPIDYGDVCINYDKAYFAAENLPLPQTFDDLTQPAYKDLLVVENPNASSPGLAFLLATIKHYGPEGYLDYWRALKANGVKVVEDWTTAYYTDFSGSSGRGARPLVVSYASSPPAEVIFAPTPEPGAPPITAAPTGVLAGPDMCFRQIEFAGVLRGARNPAGAQRFINFMLSEPFQSGLPLTMFVYPVNPAAVLPDAFVQFTTPVAQPATLDPATINAGREKWVQDWTGVMLNP